MKYQVRLTGLVEAPTEKDAVDYFYEYISAGNFYREVLETRDEVEPYIPEE